MRIFLYAILFVAIIIALFYALDPSKGNITHQQILNAKQKQELSKLPRP